MLKGNARTQRQQGEEVGQSGEGRVLASCWGLVLGRCLVQSRGNRGALHSSRVEEEAGKSWSKTRLGNRSFGLKLLSFLVERKEVKYD